METISDIPKDGTGLGDVTAEIYKNNEPRANANAASMI